MSGPRSSPLTVLSMHQPWASLLVYGLKRIEGRGWPTEHTGQLWIHSTSKQATPQEIEVQSSAKHKHLSRIRVTACSSSHTSDSPLQEMQSFYRQIHEQEGTDISPNIPKTYPTSVLLGCVDVVACYSVSFPGQPCSRFITNQLKFHKPAARLLSASIGR